jgi:ribosome-binding factor A
MEFKEQKIKEIIKGAIANFIENESNRDNSMITVTDISISNDFKRVTIFVTVFPEHVEESALDFLNRKRSEARVYLKKNTRLAKLPFIEFEVDEGEKARQKIDEVFLKIKKGENKNQKPKLK